MAEPIFYSIVTGIGASGSSFTPSTLPTGYVDGDLIVFWVGQDGGTGTFSIDTAGWSAHGTRTGSPAGGAQGSWFSAVVRDETFNTPTFKSTLTDDYAYIGFIVRGAPSSSYVDVVGAQTDWNTVGNAAAGTPTTGTNGCLVLYGWVADGSVQFRPDFTDANLIAQYRGGGQSIAVSYRQQETAGAVDAMQMYFNTAAEGGTQFTLCIKNDTGAKLAPDVRVTGDLVSWYGNFSAASAALTWKGLEETGNKFAGGFTSGLLDGITVTTGAVTTGTASAVLNNPIGTDTGITTSSTDNRIDGGWHALSGNLNGRIFSAEVSTSRGADATFSRIGTMGLLVGFSDGTNYEIFRVKNPYKGWLAGTAMRVFVACGTTTPTYSRGTLDWTAITQVAYLLHHKGTAADTLSVRNGLIIDRMTLTGGSAASPISSRDLANATSQNALVDLVGIRGKSQVQPTTKFQIGDATNTTHFSNAACSTEFPQEWSDSFTANWQDNWHVGDSSVEIRIKPKSTDSIDLSAAIFATDTLQGLVYDSGGSSSADFAHVGCSVVGFSPVELLAGTTVLGKTYSGCGPVQTHGANLTNCTVSDTRATSSQAAVTVDANGSTLDRCTIDVTGTSAGYHLELDTAVTDITLTDQTFTGTPGTDKVHVLKTTGTVTITISGTTALVAGDVTSAGATVVISAPVEYQSVTLSNYVTGSRVQIYDTTNAVELYNDIPAAAPQTLWTDSVAASTSGARDIRVRVAYVSGVTAKQFIEAAIGSVASSGSGIALSYRVNQSADTVYDANGLNGSTIYGSGEITFTDSSPDVINMDMAADTISLPTQYAAWVYYAFTSAGIATDIDYINAIDTANYEYSGIKWKNTSSPTSPLKVTGGYAWDSATLDPMDLIDDTGGTLFLAPAHVVPYATGSGVTPSDVTDIAAASATASAAAIVSAAVDGTTTLAESLRLANAVLGGKVSGAGSTAETFRNLADTKDRMVFTVDSSGNRTAVTRNLT